MASASADIKPGNASLLYRTSRGHLYPQIELYPGKGGEACHAPASTPSSWLRGDMAQLNSFRRIPQGAH